MSGIISIIAFFDGTSKDFDSIRRTMNHFSGERSIAIIRDRNVDEALLQPFKAMYPKLTVHAVDRWNTDAVQSLISTLVPVMCDESGAPSTWIDISNANQLEVYVSTIACFINGNGIYCNMADLEGCDLNSILPGYIHHLGKAKEWILCILSDRIGYALSANEIIALMEDSYAGERIPSLKQINQSLNDLEATGILKKEKRKREGFKDRNFYRITEKGRSTYNLYRRTHNADPQLC